VRSSPFPLPELSLTALPVFSFYLRRRIQLLAGGLGEMSLQEAVEERAKEQAEAEAESEAATPAAEAS
jgi:hypothetical protein